MSIHTAVCIDYDWIFEGGFSSAFSLNYKQLGLPSQATDSAQKSALIFLLAALRQDIPGAVKPRTVTVKINHAAGAVRKNAPFWCAVSP
jgi:hypothetical protein